MATYDDASRARWLRLYEDSGLSQTAFAARYREAGGPSDRTLRAWFRGALPPVDVGHQVRRVIVQAIEDLRRLLATVDSQSDARTVAVAETAAVDEAPAAVSSTPAMDPSAAASESGDPSCTAAAGGSRTPDFSDADLAAAVAETREVLAGRPDRKPRLPARRRGLFLQGFEGE